MRTTMLRRGLQLSLLLGLLAAGPHPTQAQDLPEAELGEIIVTATRYQTRWKDVPRRLEVITQEELNRAVFDDLVDLLKKRTAIDIVQYPSLLSGVGLRGFRPETGGINKRTLLLLNGRPAGAGNLATFPLSNIERIEVLKGPGSALYGSSAMGGVINLVTKRSAGRVGGQVTAAFGSFETMEVGTRVGGNATDQVDFDLGFLLFSRSDDFRIGSGNHLRSVFGDPQATKILDDGTRLPIDDLGDGVTRENTQLGYLSGHGRVGLRLPQGLRLDVGGEFFSARDVESPGDIFFGTGQDGKKNERRNTLDATLSGSVGAYQPTARLYLGNEEIDFFNTFAEDPFISFKSANETYGLQLQAARPLGVHLLTAGLDVTTARATSQSFFQEANTGEILEGAPFSPTYQHRSVALFSEAKAVFLDQALITTLGLRLDRVTLSLEETPLRTDLRPDDDVFLTVNPNLGVQYTLPSGWRLRSSLGRGFLAPAAFNRAGRSVRGEGSGTVDITVGNPGLHPESAWTLEAGLGFEKPRRGIELDAALFRTFVDHRITLVRTGLDEGRRPTTPQGDAVASLTTYVNANEADMLGLEYRLGYDFGALAGYRYSLRLFANATHLLTAEETTDAAHIDATPFEGAADFTPDAVFDAITFTDGPPIPIKNVADLTLTFGWEYDDLRRFSTRLTGRYVSARLDTDFTDFSNISDIEYPAFMVLDFATRVRLDDQFSLGIEVNNLTDENYYEKRGFNLPGRSLRLKLNASF